MRQKLRFSALFAALLCLLFVFISVYALSGASINAECKDDAVRGGKCYIYVKVSETVTVRSGSITVSVPDGVEVLSAEWKLGNTLISDYDVANGRGVFTFSRDTELVGDLITLEVKVGDTVDFGEKLVNVGVTFKNSAGALVEGSCEAKLTVVCVHEWGSGSIEREADCTQSGLVKYECSICHTPKTEETDMLSHVAGEWETAETTESGTEKMVKKCTSCGKVLEEKEITPEPSEIGEETDNGAGNDDVSDDGNGSSNTVWIIIGVIAFVAVCLFIIFK